MTKTFFQSQTLEDRINALESADRSEALGTNKAGVAYAAAHTLTLEDMGKVLTVTAASGVALTVPQDDDAEIAVGSEVDVIQGGAGAVTVTAGTGATLHKAAATAKILAQYGRVTIRKTAADTWVVNGELAAS